MSDAIIVALITGGVTLSANLISNHSARKKEAIDRAVKEQKLNDRLDRLEKKVSSHNAYAEKFASTTTAIVAIQKDIEWIKGKS